ncbi:MAG: TonB-dependent receptor [Proteobacteria bacterium]|nr:TonB-dependent receptor [Pseudomonadota bacterium]
MSTRRLVRVPFAARPLAILLGASLIAGTAHAADTTETTLETLVVTASAQAQALKDAPASISVISAEDLQKKPVSDLTQILSTVEGVTLKGSGNQRTVQIRGLDSAYVLLLIDGKRVDSTSAVFRGNDYDTGWVPVDGIERIEVVRGPMSSLYGSDAMGGVINIITRKVGKTWQGSVTGEYTYQENRDAGDSYRTGFYVAGPLIADTLGLKLYGSYDHREADGSVNPSAQAGFPDNRNKSVNATLNWAPAGNQDIELDVGSSQRNHSDQQIERKAISVAHKGRWGFGNTEIKLAADQIENLTGNVSGAINPSKATNASLDGKISLPVDFLREQLLTFGAETRYQKLEDPANLSGWPGSTSYGQDPTTSVSQYALFVEDEISLRDNLKLTLGNRMDHHENFGAHHSPRAYLVYHATEGLTFKGGWAKAFRAPTLLQNSPNWGSVSCGSATTGCFIIGSKDLKPETSTSEELGVQYDARAWSAGATVFRNDIKDMIDITSRTSNKTLAPTYSNFVGFLTDGRPVFKYQNINKVRTKGVELAFSAKLGKEVSWLNNYTYLDATNLSGSKPLPLVYRPRHSANSTLDWQFNEKLALALTGKLTGEQYISVPSSGTNLVKKGGYVSFDVSSSYDLQKNITVRAGVLNITDKTIERANSSDYNEDGRRYYLALTTRF